MFNTLSHAIKGHAAALALPVLLSACGTAFVPPDFAQHRTSSEKPLRVGQMLMQEGLDRLNANRIDDASRLFNAGLKFEPDNLRLHLLNGLTYHLLSLRNDTGARTLAEAGYQLVLARDPGNYLAALMVSRLYLENRDYKKAIQAFEHTLKIDPLSGEAYLGLAAASYYMHDLPGARAAVDKAHQLLPDRSDAARAAAVIFSANGESLRAHEALRRFSSLEPSGVRQEALAQRVDQWRAWRVSATAPSDGADASPATAASGSAASPAPGEGGAAAGSASARGAEAADSGPSTQPRQPRWTDCDTAPANPQSLAAVGGSLGGSNSSSGDETLLLPPLPSPCKGMPLPRMAMFDVNILRTEDTNTSSHGINLLDGLSLFYSLTNIRSNSASPGSPVGTTLARGLGGGGDAASASSAIAYSLNIANAANTRSEVLARPTIVALDRQPSNFFSGRNLTLGISGQAGGTSTLADRPIGISLSITPTFVDDDTLLVSVRVTRSFLEAVNESVKFESSFQTSRAALTANVLMRFGQTLILSGLTEHEIQHTHSGVPLLKDIPVLQYLFSNMAAQNFTSAVMVVLTPRKPVRDADDVAQALASPNAAKGLYAIKEMSEDFLALNRRVTPTLDSVLWHTRSNSMYLQFRDGDVRTEDWNEGTRMQNLLKEIGRLIYF